MKIPILFIHLLGSKKFLHIEKNYKSTKTIVPIGNDCHPAYTLQTLFLRKSSFPFDWLNINPIKSLKYVNDNLQNQFTEFLDEPEINERGYFVSKKFPEAEFMHEKEMDCKDSIEKFERRITRLLRILQTDNVIYLHNLPVEYLKNENDINEYLINVRYFLNTITLNCTLHIYLRYDENEEENNEFVNKLTIELDKLNLHYCKYVRKLNHFGIWGNKEDYPKLYKSLKIDIKMTFPKIYIK